MSLFKIGRLIINISIFMKKNIFNPIFEKINITHTPITMTHPSHTSFPNFTH